MRSKAKTVREVSAARKDAKPRRERITSTKEAHEKLLRALTDRRFLRRKPS